MMQSNLAQQRKRYKERKKLVRDKDFLSAAASHAAQWQNKLQRQEQQPTNRS